MLVNKLSISESDLSIFKQAVHDLWDIISRYPELIGSAADINTKGQRARFKRTLRKEDVEDMIKQSWNKKHPYYQVK